MSNPYSESEWRCPSDGAFHVLDFANLQRQDEAPCIHCGQWVSILLVNDGMANCVNAPPAPPPAPPTVIKDLNFFNTQLKVWLGLVYENHIGDALCSVQGVTQRSGLSWIEVRSHAEASLAPRIPQGLDESKALQWCKDYVAFLLPDPYMRYMVRRYPEASYIPSGTDPDTGAVTEEGYGFRFRIFVLEEKP